MKKALVVLSFLTWPFLARAADNVAVTAGSGTTIAADEVSDGTLGSVKAQYIKLMDGTLDSTNKATVSSGGALKVDGSAVTQPTSAKIDGSSNTVVLGAGTAEIGNVKNSGTFAVQASQPAGTLFTVTPSTSVGNSNGNYLTYVSTFANISASQTNQVLVSTISSTVIRVVSVSCIAGGTATNLTFGQGAGTAISPLFANGANGGFVLPLNPMGWFETSSGSQLLVTTGSGSATGCLINYLRL